jgi:hypothetical protein
MSLREIIKESLLLEKRIGQISANLDITFGFDVITTKHSVDRSTGRDLDGYNQRVISNKEIIEVINQFKRDIAEKIINDEISDGDNFVIISNKWELAIPIIAEKEFGLYWKLIVKTLFRQSEKHKIFTGKNQIVFEK